MIGRYIDLIKMASTGLPMLIEEDQDLWRGRCLRPGLVKKLLSTEIIEPTR